MFYTVLLLILVFVILGLLYGFTLWYESSCVIIGFVLGCAATLSITCIALGVL